MGIKARTSNSNSNNSKDLAGNSNNNSKIKSHSVENLMDPTSSVLGLKSANSETLLNYPNYARRRLSGTTSELNVNRIGTSEKVKVFETLEGVTSLPVELTKGLKGQVKPNRDKIRAILSMSSVIELQRHLLTTVMENEVRFLICFDLLQNLLFSSILLPVLFVCNISIKNGKEVGFYRCFVHSSTCCIIQNYSFIARKQK